MGEVGTTKVYENEKIIVWEFTLEPGEETPLHEHKHDRVLCQVDWVGIES